MIPKPLLMFLALGATAACAVVPGQQRADAPTSAAALAAPAPVATGLGPALPEDAGDAEAYPGDQLGARACAVDIPVDLEPGGPNEPLTWRVLPRDADRARVEPGHVAPPADPAKARLRTGQVLIARAPGAVTLEATAPGGRRAFVQFAAFRASDVQGPVDFPFADVLAPIFPRPLVIRDLETWQGTFLAWWRASDPDLVGDVQPPPPAPGGIAFPHRNLLLVDLETPFGRFGHSPIVTHIEDGVVHVAVPEGFEDAPKRPATSPPPFVRADQARPRQAWAFNLPTLPAGVQVHIAPFPESTRPRWAPDAAAD